ncbi:MAG TPA: GNAT family N-acetyltransferase [Candidatus Nanoarchaeia archaeon]|nr:GNAT family N-acetyltransferase [Candidatus Nanoarchaeia archaeon]
MNLSLVNNVVELDRLIPLKLLDEIESGDSSATPEKVARMIANYWQGGASFILANSEGLDVGFGIGIGRPHSSSYLISKVYVHPVFRNRGIGKSIEEAQREHARLLGMEYLVSRVDIDNVSSLRVQEKMGAQVICRYPGAILFKIPVNN